MTPHPDLSSSQREMREGVAQFIRDRAHTWISHERATDDDDDLDFEEFCALSDEQREAVVDGEMYEYVRWYDSLPLNQKIAHRRANALDNCRTKRRLIAMPHCPEIIKRDCRERLRSTQLRLLKIRIWRETGTYPGEA